MYNIIGTKNEIYRLVHLKPSCMAIITQLKKAVSELL